MLYQLERIFKGERDNPRIKNLTHLHIDNVSLVCFPASSDHNNRIIILDRSHSSHKIMRIKFSRQQ